MLSKLKSSEIIQKVHNGWSLNVSDRYASKYYWLSKKGEESIFLKKNSAQSIINKHFKDLEENYISFTDKSYESKTRFKTLSIVYVRSSQSSFGSGDVIMFAEQNLTKILTQLTSTSYTEYIETEGNIVKVIHITVAPKIINIKDGWNKEKKKEVADNLKEKYPTLSTGRPEYYEDYLKLNSIKNSIIEQKDRLDKGYVLTETDSKKRTTKDYVGGFLLETFFTEVLISYVEKGICYGYIGHNCRKVWVDEMLSNICLKHIKPDDFACWLTSTDGRHFGDYIEYMVESEDRLGVENYIKEKLPSIHDKSVIYNHPSHKGTFSSSLELFEHLKDLGMMMSNNYTY